MEIARLALEKHASNAVILKIKKLSTVSDYLFICSADSERQVQAIANSVIDGLRSKGERPLGVEGVADGRWALLDFNDVVAHIFLDKVRGYYDIEGLWADAEVVEVADGASGKAERGAGKKR